MKTKIKICCISSIEEAKLAINSGADALGLVGRMASGPGVISDELIQDIVKTIPPPINTFLLTNETTENSIIEHHRKVNTNTIQIVNDNLSLSYSYIRECLPFVKIIQVIHVVDEQSVKKALGLSNKVDALLLDSGNPNNSVKELGGTGRTHNWTLSRKIVEKSKVPVFLAGGLNPNNVREAIEQVQPFGVDLCSGVRTKGKLDKEKLDRFIKAVIS